MATKRECVTVYNTTTGIALKYRDKFYAFNMFMPLINIRETAYYLQRGEAQGYMYMPKSFLKTYQPKYTGTKFYFPVKLHGQE